MSRLGETWSRDARKPKRLLIVRPWSRKAWKRAESRLHGYRRELPSLETARAGAYTPSGERIRLCLARRMPS